MRVFLVFLALFIISPFNSQASVSTADKQLLVQNFETLSTTWNQSVVNETNGLLAKDEYSTEDWIEFFSEYFETHTFTTPLRNYLCCPLFVWFPDYIHLKLQLATKVVFFSHVNQLIGKDDLESNESNRYNLFNMMGILDGIALASNSVVPDSTKQTIFLAAESWINQYPEFYKRTAGIDLQQHPYQAIVGSQIQLILLAEKELTKSRLNYLVNLFGLKEKYAEILLKHKVLICDNNKVGNKALTFIDSLLTFVPDTLTKLRFITHYDSLFYKNQIKDLNLSCVNLQGVNMAGRFGWYTENQFPSDIEPKEDDIFCSIVIHEVTHTFDPGYIYPQKKWNDRRAQLISQTGSEDLQFLRSQIGSAFFHNAPQEFVASIGNQWFCNSKHTLDLALLRFDNGYKEPINQFLFMADLFSANSDTTIFFRINELGEISRELVTINRDVNLRINQILFGDYCYTFELNSDGNVTSYTKQICSLNILKDSYIISNQNTTGTFNISSNTFWKVNSDQNWIQFDKTTGYNNSELKFRVNANPLLTSRTALISISGIGIQTKTISIVQAAKKASLSISSNWKYFNSQSGLIDDNVYAISIDQQKNKWFGTFNGVSKYDGESWTSYTIADGLGYNDINTIGVDPQGNVWFGTCGGGVSKYDGSNWTTFNTTNSGIADDYIWSLEFENNNIWFGTWGLGVSKLKDNDWTTYSNILGSSNDYIISDIKTDKSGNKWISSTVGIAKLNENSNTIYTSSDGLIDNFVTCVAIDSKGDKWFGTVKGISKFDGENWISYTTNDGLVYDSVSSIIIDKYDNKWIGTYAGISKFDGVNWFTYNNDQGAGYTIAIDDQNTKWISNNKGASCFDDTVIFKFDKIGLNTINFRITSNTNWSITPSDSWIIINKPTGNNNSDIILNAAVNPSTTERSATITISGEGISPQIYNVTQDASEPTLNISKTELNINYAEGSSSNFSVTSNTNWTVTSNQNWLAVSNSSGSNNSTICLTASENPSTVDRTAIITVSAIGVDSKTLTITQDGALPVLSISESSLTIGASTNSIATFSIISNVDWTIVSDQNWLTVSSSSGSNNLTLRLTASENPSTLERSAIITVSANGNSKTLTVTQTGSLPVLSVSESNLTIGAPANSTATFSITSNTNWTIMSDQNWLKVSNSSGSNNSTISLVASENSTTVDRIATITVLASGLDSKIITITQSPIITNIKDPNKSELIIYPIPVKDVLYIKSNGVLQYYVSIYSINGIEIYSSICNKEISEIQMGSFQNGFYILELRYEEKIILKKIVKN